MARFERRLKALEARFTDRNGLVPHTQPWWDYWVQTMTSALSERRVQLTFVSERVR